jgi:hypothetical protein
MSRSLDEHTAMEPRGDGRDARQLEGSALWSLLETPDTRVYPALCP